MRTKQDKLNRSETRSKLASFLGLCALFLLVFAAFSLVFVRGFLAYIANPTLTHPNPQTTLHLNPHPPSTPQNLPHFPTEYPQTTASLPSHSHANLNLLAEWILIAHTLNRTLILPSLQRYRTADKSYQAVFTDLSTQGGGEAAVAMADWFQVFGNWEYADRVKGDGRGGFGDTIRELHAKSDSVVAPLTDYLRVVTVEEWNDVIGDGGARKRGDSKEIPVSVVFVNNADVDVECSSEHDDLAWPEWTAGFNSSGHCVKFERVVSDICLFSLKESDPAIEDRIMNQSPEEGMKVEEDDEDDEDENQNEDSSANSVAKQRTRMNRPVQIYGCISETITETARLLVSDPSVHNADLLIVRKQCLVLIHNSVCTGQSSTFPIHFTSSLLSTTILSPHQSLYTLIRTALRTTTKTPLVAFRWNLHESSFTLTQDQTRTCAATLLKHVKKILKMQNWHLGFLPPGYKPDPSLPPPDDPIEHATVYMSTGLYPHYDAHDVFQKPVKLTSLAPVSMNPPPQHLLNVYWFLRKRIHGYIDLSHLFEASQLASVHALFWRVVEEVLFEEADVFVYGGYGSECHGGGDGGSENKGMERRRVRGFEVFPEVSEDDTEAPRDGEGRRVVYRTLTWK
ncbi:hypothetical protein BCR33DRAFT_719516 [Rhizoclosmatium globosum]|uniref:Uncharacterized protein n=1 Tax=Rhizoclosmatium globosum TaxID=329046 RepID=A0A1Y2BZB6_9FUNG|nr:hypothetical protein BCR33DRAFT_719516 [Rhizoclosmatium globosum]|eukprot:ORY40110.1 hypothetical protein BCR33DRAFT_719516 [Rhizoclosmatium globosum]